MQEMRAAAEKLGASAVVGADLDDEVLGQTNRMPTFSVSGKAVVVE